MGFFDAFKKSKREIVRDNQDQGKSGEEHVRRNYEFNGYKVANTGRGHDLKAKRRNWLTGKNETKYIEVKTGNSPLSDLQKKKKRQLGSKYVVERLESTPFGFIPKESKSKRKSSGYDSLFGTGSSRKRKSSGFDDMFGLGSGSSTKRKKSSGFDDMFGTGSSRKRTSSGYGNLWGTGSSRKRKSDFW